MKKTERYVLGDDDLAKFANFLQDIVVVYTRSEQFKRDSKSRAIIENANARRAISGRGDQVNPKKAGTNI